MHGTDDPLLPYGQMVQVYNSLHGPKGVLTLQGADHQSWMRPGNTYFATALAATVDFFDAYLRGDATAKKRLPADEHAGVATIHFAATPGSTATIATVPIPKTDRHATVTPTKDLTDGQQITVQWSGFPPGKVVNVVECAPSADSTSAACDIGHGKVLVPDPTGLGSLTLNVVEGKVGTGICDATHPGCQIVVNDASGQEPGATLKFDISFAP